MPAGNFRFKLEIDGLTVGGFSEISGLSTEMRVLEYKEGGLNSHSLDLIEGFTHSNIVIKKGALDASLLKWYKNIAQGQIELKSGSVVLLDQSATELMRWNFNDAYPVKFTSSDFSGLESTVIIETLELVHTGTVLSVEEATKNKTSEADKPGSADTPKSQKEKKEDKKEEKKKSSMFGFLDALEDVVDDAFDAVGLDYELTKGKLVNETFANLDTDKLTNSFAAVAIKGIVNGDAPEDILKDTGNALVDDLENAVKENLEPFEDAAKAGLKAYNEGQSLDQVAGKMAGAYAEKKMENMGYPPYACRVGGAGAEAGAISMANGGSPAEAKAAAYGAMASTTLQEMGMEKDRADLVGKATEEYTKRKKGKGGKTAKGGKAAKGGKGKKNKRNKKKKNNPNDIQLKDYSKKDVDEAIEKASDAYDSVKSAFGF